MVTHRWLAPDGRQMKKLQKRLKGTGTRDYNSVELVWFDRLGESAVYTHNFLTVPSILYLIKKFLTIYR
jgi:hypothetical protein